jgi:hypothetical protein
MPTISNLGRLTLLLLAAFGAAKGQAPPPAHEGTWDVSAWAAGATGEETRNSFTQTQIWTGGLFFGRVITGQIGRGWRQFNLEYGFDLVPLFAQSGNATIFGGRFDPILLRFNSSHKFGRALPYIELGGGTLFTTANLPPGNTGSFNFTVRGGGNLRTD